MADRPQGGGRKEIPMNRVLGIAAAGALLALPACRSGAKWENDQATGAKRLEVQVDAHGRHGEVEYHISASEVPEAVQRAMNELHPGGPFEDAERESHKGKVYYELSRKVGGMEVEAMFTPDGKLHEEEIQVPMSKVPGAVQSAVKAAYPDGRVSGWEEIRNSKREVYEYHVKVAHGGNKYKLLIAPDGKHLGTYREVPAEIEVKVR
jgi:hypothetical protein